MFVNQSLDEIAALVDATPLSMVQLHGDEGTAFCAEVARRTGARVIRPPGSPARPTCRRCRRFRNVDFHVVDARVPGMRGGTGHVVDWDLIATRYSPVPLILSGGLTAENVGEAIERVRPYAVDVASGNRVGPGYQGPRAAARLRRGGSRRRPRGGAAVSGRVEAGVEHRFGPYGGQYVPETLMPAVQELEALWVATRDDPDYRDELGRLLRDYVGRPSPLYLAERLSEVAGASCGSSKREDLNHTGSHKINNALGQALLAKRMGKPRVIAETGAGSHGVATATACALLGLECVVYMGAEDVRRQQPNVQRMRMLGAEVVSVDAGARTLKEAVSEALRDWVTNVATSHYVIGSVVGPAPYPSIVRDLQRVIGDEARAQILERRGRLPDRVLACVGGGSNAIGTFAGFYDDPSVALVGVEAAGEGIDTGRHGAPLTVGGRGGVLHGSFSAIMQDAEGQILEAHSVSAGLDYPGAGPEHAWLRDTGRATYVAVTDDQALAAFREVARLEGIVPALETAHALHYALHEPSDSELDVLCLSGRGDKDLAEVLAKGEA